MKLSILVLSLFVFPAISGAEETMESRKSQALAELDERIQKLQEHRTCIASASDKEALRNCHQQMKEWRQSERAEHMGRRKERIEGRMKRMEEKN